MSELQIRELVVEEIIVLPTGEKKITKKRQRTGTLRIGGSSISAKKVISMVGKGLIWLGKRLLPFCIVIHSAVSSCIGTSMPVNIQDNAIGPKTIVEETLFKISDNMAVDPKK